MTPEDTMRTLLALLLPFLIAIAANAPLSGADVTHSADPLDQVKAAVESGKAVLVDVREQGEWDLGHLKDARLVPLSALSKEGAVVPADLPKDKPVYLHCRSGARCLKAAEILKPLGYDVRPLKAGFGELVKSGFPKAE
jgi:rhodanese-related sulfurtransferase